MHPDLMREITRQRVAQWQEEARRAGLVRALRGARRQRDRAAAANMPTQPVPDYADGAIGGARDKLPAGRVGAARP